MRIRELAEGIRRVVASRRLTERRRSSYRRFAYYGYPLGQKKQQPEWPPDFVYGLESDYDVKIQDLDPKRGLIELGVFKNKKDAMACVRDVERMKEVKDAEPIDHIVHKKGRYKGIDWYVRIELEDPKNLMPY